MTFIIKYAIDAISTLGAGDACVPDADRRWVLAHAATTLSEIETATLRLVALRMSRSHLRAARQLGMSHVALRQWVGRRKLTSI